MTDEQHKQLDLKKRIFRRNAAIISMVILIIMVFFYGIVGLFVSNETAKAIAEFNGVQIMLSGVFVSILLGHLGIDYFEKKK